MFGPHFASCKKKRIQKTSIWTNMMLLRFCVNVSFTSFFFAFSGILAIQNKASSKRNQSDKWWPQAVGLKQMTSSRWAMASSRQPQADEQWPQADGRWQTTSSRWVMASSRRPQADEEWLQADSLKQMGDGLKQMGDGLKSWRKRWICVICTFSFFF